MKTESTSSVVPNRQSRQMLRRGAVLAAVFGIGGLALLLARLYKLQIADHAFYESLAIEQQLRSTASATDRGRILDINGNILAVSASVDNVYLSPAEIAREGEDRALIARGLSQILHLDYNDVYEKTGRQGSWYVTVARKVEQETADEIRRFKTENNLKGVRLETDTKRYYPNSNLASHLIGFVGIDNYGLEGVEAQYNDALSGTAGKTQRATNAYGTEMLFTEYEQYLPGEGAHDVVLTLDATIQYYVEKHLRQAVADYDVLNGAGAIAMNPKTGAI
ncbi:MAG: hypothetical protein IJV41_02995, partial [Oscillospiraceae bacterium]|nr:hypothetical protein [Oscillospiraceae bacterium]